MAVRRKGKLIVVQGGHYGSEAKGLICAKLAHDRKVDIMVRTGTVNAGHTVPYQGRQYKMQQLPVGWMRPECQLVIGAGAFVHPEILEREMQMVGDATGEGIQGVRSRLYIDNRCGLHLPIHTHRSSDANRHHSMGATGKGCSEAVVDKIVRRGMGQPTLFKDWWATQATAHLAHGMFIDTARLLNKSYDRGNTILIEGTQGTLLDLHLGPYPYTTHKQTQAASWLAECGLSCTLPIELILVMRTFPIRVAGNSGPLPKEIGWDLLAQMLNDKLYKADLPALVQPWAIVDWMAKLAETTAALLRDAGAEHAMPYDPAMWRPDEKLRYASIASEAHARAWEKLDPPAQAELAKLFERTTVTNKLRRISMWDSPTAAESVMLNRPSSVVLTFVNYEFPEAWGCTRASFGALPVDVRKRIYSYIRDKQEELGYPISMVGFGPLEENTFSLYEDELGEATCA